MGKYADDLHCINVLMQCRLIFFEKKLLIRQISTKLCNNMCHNNLKIHYIIILYNI